MQFQKVLRLLPIIGLLIFLVMRRKKKVIDNKVSENFTLKEFGLTTESNPQLIENATRLIEKVLQPARTKLALPIYISSGYRDAATNEKVKGSETSHHLTASAADIAPLPNNYYNRQKLFDIIQEGPFDEVILYPPGYPGYTYGGIHVALKKSGNRKRVIKK